MLVTRYNLLHEYILIIQSLRARHRPLNRSTSLRAQRATKSRPTFKASLTLESARAHSFYEHYDTTYFDMKSWDEEREAFYYILSKLDESFQEKIPNQVTLEQLLQGPLSDTMAHIGQLLLLRRMVGSPIAAENFLKADIQKGVLGPNQPEPVAPDE